MNWYKESVVVSKLYEKYDIQTIKIAQLYGNMQGDTFAITGPGTYDARAEISRAGFRWDKAYGEKGAWLQDVNKLTQNANALATLQNLGVNTSMLQAVPAGPQPAVPQPAAPQPAAPQPATQPELTNTETGEVSAGPDYSEGNTIEQDYEVIERKPAQYGTRYKLKDEAGTNVDVVTFLKDNRLKGIVRIRGVVNNKEYKGYQYVQLARPTLISAIEPTVVQPLEDPTVMERTEKGKYETVEEETKGKPKPEDIRLPEEFLSPYNKAIRQQFLTDSNIMVNALAGTGKTTQLKDLSSFIKPGEKWLYLVFNKKNQLEASSEFPEGVEVATTHSFLGRLLGSVGKEIGGETNLSQNSGQRMNKILEELIPRHQPKYGKPNRVYGKFAFSATRRIKELAEKAKNSAIDPSSPDIEGQLQQLAMEYAIDFDLSTERMNQDRDYTTDLLRDATKLLTRSLPTGKMRGTRDHDDTLWYSGIYADQIQWPKYDVVLMDEVQDFNQCQLVMAQKLKEAGARTVAVGDPFQAIYRFRGADSHAFERLQGIVTEGQSEAMPLPINFRSLPAIIDFVTENTHVKDLQAAPETFWQAKGIDPNSGEVQPSVDNEQFMLQLQDENRKNNGKLDEETAIISRTNAPLVSFAMQLLRDDIDFQILGRDLSKELVDHIQKVTWRKPGNYNIAEFNNPLSEHADRLERQWIDKITKQDELKQVQDTTEALTGVLEHLERVEYRPSKDAPSMKTALDFIGYIEDKLSGLEPDNVNDYKEIKDQKQRDPAGFVTLTTAHRSKGMEYERVFILQPEDFDLEGERSKHSAEVEQEKNAWYVSLTRAKRKLMIGRTRG